MNVPRFYIENFGCRATQADGAALERQFLDRGLERAGAARDAEIVVLNTWTVTESVDKDARASIGQCQRVNPDCRILVTGCYAQRAPEELAALPGVTWVVGNSHKHQAAEIATGSAREFVPLWQLSSSHQSPSAAKAVSEDATVIAAVNRCATQKQEGIFLRQKQEGVFPRFDQVADDKIPEVQTAQVIVGDIFAHTELMAAPVFEAANERTRPNLKVQDGCDNRCSFCVIPYVRGQSRSLPLERVIAEVRTLVEAGYREVVISGINLGRWGRDVEGSSQLSGVSSQLKQKPTSRGLESLVRAILDQTSLEKLRISSVEPMDWSDELINLMATSPRIAKHAHVPLQSGSDTVLRRMHRKYRPWHYREKIEKIRDAMPEAAIGADVMVGFPGETEDEFEETRRMIEDLPFTYLHVFTYSARPGTPAAEMANQVPVQVARERNGVLRELAAKKKLHFMRSFVGMTVDAITLSADGRESTEALTDNYLKLRLRGRHESNHWVHARVEDVLDGTLLGSVSDEPVIDDVTLEIRAEFSVD